jgi:hypothetical protein
MANTRTGNVLPRGRYSEAKHDVVDSRYFTASPVNMEYPPNTQSGSEGYVKSAWKNASMGFQKDLRGTFICDVFKACLSKFL